MKLGTIPALNKRNFFHFQANLLNKNLHILCSLPFPNPNALQIFTDRDHS